MTSGPQRLPPLKALPAFEAVARLHSVTLAAAELNLTQSAVSRQISNLEQRLGARLFDRSQRQLRLTEAGQIYLASVHEALALIAQATVSLREHGNRGPVTIGASTALASLWLMPRITGLRSVEPDLPIRILASDFQLPENNGQLDLVISYARATPSVPDAQKLFDECIFPVCSPDWLRHAGPIDSIDCLLAQTLLIHDDDHPDWVGWNAWLHAMQRRSFRPERALRLNAYSMVLQAAVAGQGIALGWSHLVDDYLAAGSLVALPVGTLRTDGAFYLRTLKPCQPGSHSAQLRDWLIASADDGALQSALPLADS